MTDDPRTDAYCVLVTRWRAMDAAMTEDYPEFYDGACGRCADELTALLIRSGEAEAEVQAQRLNVRDVELARQILATDNYMGVARDDAKRLARAVLDSHATTLGPPRRVWELCLDCDGDGHRGQAQGENGKMMKLLACETCGGHEDALGTGWISRDDPWSPPASVSNAQRCHIHGRIGCGTCLLTTCATAPLDVEVPETGEQP